MVHVRISCHADLQALQDRSDELMVVELVSLESLRIASDTYAFLRDLMERKSRQYPQVGLQIEWRYWDCPQIHLLSLVAGVALELHKIRHDLYPLLAAHDAKLEEGGFLKALLLLKNSALALLRLAKDVKEILELLDAEEEDVPFFLGKVGKVEEVGKVVKDTAGLVLKGTHDIAWLQLHLPSVLQVVDVLLSTPVLFPDL